MTTQATPVMLYHLFTRMSTDGDIPPPPTTTEEQIYVRGPFYTTVLRLINQDIPSLDLPTKNSTLEDFLALNINSPY